MDVSRGYYAQRKINTIWSHLYLESKKQTKQNKNRLIDTENKWVVAKKTKFGGMSEIKVIGKWN